MVSLVAVMVILRVKSEEIRTQETAFHPSLGFSSISYSCHPDTDLDSSNITNRQRLLDKDGNILQDREVSEAGPVEEFFFYNLSLYGADGVHHLPPFFF